MYETIKEIIVYLSHCGILNKKEQETNKHVFFIL